MKQAAQETQFQAPAFSARLGSHHEISTQGLHSFQKLLAPTSEEAFPKMWGSPKPPTSVPPPPTSPTPSSPWSICNFAGVFCFVFFILLRGTGHFTVTALRNLAGDPLCFWFLWVRWDAYHPGGDVWQTSHIRFN